MGQQPPKSFPPPGEYRGTGGDNDAVAQVQAPAQVTAASALSQPVATPTVQSPNSTSPINPSVNVAAPTVGPIPAPILNPIANRGSINPYSPISSQVSRKVGA